MEIGELWAYGSSDTWLFSAVKILKIEEKRVLVAYVDADGVEGMRKRVMPRFLRVLWEDQQEFRTAARIREADLYAEADAALFIFEHFISPDAASSFYRRESLTIDDPDALSEMCGLSVDAINSPYIDRYMIARAAAGVHSDGLLRKVDEEERSDYYAVLLDAENGSYGWSYMTDDEPRLQLIAQEAGRLTLRRNAVLRMWAGQPAVDRALENDQLRVELLRTGMVARRAVKTLEDTARTQRDRRLAAELHALLPPAFQWRIEDSSAR